MCTFRIAIAIAAMKTWFSWPYLAHIISAKNRQRDRNKLIARIWGERVKEKEEMEVEIPGWYFVYFGEYQRNRDRHRSRYALRGAMLVQLGFLNER